MYRRFNANKMTAPKWITLLLSLTIGGSGKIRSLSSMMKNLRRETEFQSFVKNETNCVPEFMIEAIKRDLGPMWHWLPNKSLSYDSKILSNSTHPLNLLSK
jgi:hypothetical protein